MQTVAQQTRQLITARNLIAMLLTIHAQSGYCTPTYPNNTSAPRENLHRYLKYAHQHQSFCFSNKSPFTPNYASTVPHLYTTYHALRNLFTPLIAATLHSDPILPAYVANLIHDLDVTITRHFSELLAHFQQNSTNPPIPGHPDTPSLPFQFLIAALQPHLRLIPSQSSALQLARISSILDTASKGPHSPLFPLVPSPQKIESTPYITELIQIPNTPHEQPYSLRHRLHLLQVNLSQHPTAERRTLPLLPTLQQKQSFLVHHVQRTTCRLPWNPETLPCFSALLQLPRNAPLQQLFLTANAARRTDFRNTPQDSALAEEQLLATLQTISNTPTQTPEVPPTSNSQTTHATPSVAEPLTEIQKFLKTLHEEVNPPNTPPAPDLAQNLSSPVLKGTQPRAYTLTNIAYSYHAPSSTINLNVSCALEFTPLSPLSSSAPLSNQIPHITITNSTLFLCASYTHIEPPTPREIQIFLHSLIQPLYLQTLRSPLQQIINVQT